MSNPPKQKGTAFETSMLTYYQQFWPDAHRNVLHGAADRGDIGGMADVIECKNVRGLSLPGALREAQAEANNAGKVGFVVVHKCRGVTDPAEQLVTMRNWHYVELLLSV